MRLLGEKLRDPLVGDPGQGGDLAVRQSRLVGVSDGVAPSLFGVVPAGRGAPQGRVGAHGLLAVRERLERLLACLFGLLGGVPPVGAHDLLALGEEAVPVGVGVGAVEEALCVGVHGVHYA